MIENYSGLAVPMPKDPTMVLLGFFYGFLSWNNGPSTVPALDLAAVRHVGNQQSSERI